MIDLLALILVFSGIAFFFFGAIGLLRLPDLHSRLHALTKADNLGLGLVIVGVALLHGSPLAALKLLLIWLLVLLGSAASAHLISQYALRRRRQ
ncbi:MAG: monovalent cation/H(+) antiporter subunit G [Candidatus Thiodiazotropha sp. (ex Ctena orbiculata)]|uniref:Monovalent cation/H(+) antiporter subunit G n=1 Tax=Candidatus Thiodiazotropha taylori TaxID=2792791 RepID=A0A944M5V5_9GAMM|nr:monovalent cation/H(+) antiporter subunit G [Candidatus Thiodiazotropha taylori]MBT2987745.1 monovalent cation/H(+) antiporter subunit G [Candidatus Thiodiazotropha taylori]MBT2995868.1 monovalent cation/H(+) antiporter subunit G [Candidatus Thiodiazotropha taylori]MBT2999183.1 monovalent cation/H(+) antiporter subunit G [Candidatus Thiodiazotropha taylori]MBT3026049.1 monovalent cation/H(+) antiporter subunit G [Candidatus Thiodiazotropha taylori]